jgi:DNA-binding NtrC family response regulator
LVGGEQLTLGTTSFRVERKRADAKAKTSLRTGFGRVIGASLEMRRLYPYCERLASSMVAAVIEGETGTGKEVMAEAIHEEGPRAGGPFVVFDCTAVPPNLVESELFGHERGAFTGAVSRRKGVFEQAHGGTLLIDEIGDLDIGLQPKLLRALDRAEIRRVGDDHPIRVDVRVLAATRRNLDHEVAAQRFRDDLFHRLCVARIELPPLRRRRGDVGILARHFCKLLGGDETLLGPALLSRWEEYEWPGNVRELRNAVARHLAFGDLPRPEDSGEEEDGAGASSAEGATDVITRVLGLELPLLRARQLVVEEFEQRYIARVLAAHGGNVTKAASASGIARRHFYRLRSRRQS